MTHRTACAGRPAGMILLFAFFALAGRLPVSAQGLTAEDDTYGIPYGAALVVEPFGVLENDLLDSESAGEMGAAAELVLDAPFGDLTLNADGSFTYSPGAGFDGTDSFVYRALFDTLSAEATVSLSACEGGPDLYTCWNETAYLALAGQLGYASFQEGFEDAAAWGGARSPVTSPVVSSRGVRWTSNHPDPPALNGITTGPGPARTGLWAVFDLEHGYATGTVSECDIDTPPPHCYHNDGFTGTRETGLNPFHGVGGYVTGTYGAKVGISIEGAPVVGGGQITGPHQFFGVIDTGPAGFSRFSFRETEGKIGNALYIFADDFTMLTEEPTGVTAREGRGAPDDLRAFIPNPSAAGSSLHFDLRTGGRVRAAIYDVRGALVRNLADEFRGSGPQVVQWDGRDDGGRKVSPGLYFGRLIINRGAERDVTVRKITVVR